MGYPVDSARRFEVIDILRGFALFGILLINITAFYAPGGPPGLAFDGSTFDRLVIYTLILFVESKFFTLFSFLFGVGFSIQLSRAQQSGKGFVRRFVRRLLALALFGVAHTVLLWDGDILLLYAFVGFILLLFRNASVRTLLRWVSALLIVPLLLVATGLILTQVARTIPASSAQLQQGDEEVLIQFARSRVEAVQNLSGGTYWRILERRVASYGETFFLLLSRVPSVLAMFLLGMWTGKKGILQHVGDNMPLLQRVRFWGLLLGLLTSLLTTLGYAWLPPISALITLFFNQTLAGPLLSLGYAATLVLLAERPPWQRALKPLTVVGRMSLTNYLAQSFICAVIFSGYGFGLAGKVAPVVGVLIAGIIFSAQVLFSKVWLHHYRFGPMEWLWRSITYLKPQPMRPPASV